MREVNEADWIGCGRQMLRVTIGFQAEDGRMFTEIGEVKEY